MLGCTDDLTAGYFSARSGDISVQVETTMTTKKTVAVAQVIPQYRENLGHGKRKLLTPDEVLRLPQEEMLVVIRGQNMLKLNKFDYTKHPMSKQMIPASIFDYSPSLSYVRPAVPHTPPEAKQPPRTQPDKVRICGSGSPPPEF